MHPMASLEEVIAKLDLKPLPSEGGFYLVFNEANA
jgi:hypothetical protein